MYTVPCSNDLLNSIRVPMGLIVQPMASVKSEEVCDSLTYASTLYTVKACVYVKCFCMYICITVCMYKSALHTMYCTVR